MIGRASRRGALSAAAVLTLVACSGSSSDSVNGPGATFATTPTADSVDAQAETTEPVDAVGDTTPPADSEPAEAATAEPVQTTPPTTLLVTSGNDVPTASPDQLTETTEPPALVGPLPIPVIDLVEFGQFDTPVEVFNRDLDERTFVVEQGGQVLVADDLSSDVLLDITDLTEASGERGLLGAAFHPDQELAYAHYSDDSGDTVVAEFAVDPVTAVFDRESMRVVLTVEQPFGNHNGGELAFGPDGFLYVGLGDGGSSNDPERSSLDLGSRLGKILRIDPLEAGDQAFTVPGDNPFVTVDDADPTIWSVGLRNPWRFSFDEITGDLWIADVGQNEFEEVNFAPATSGLGAGKGLSFGWSAFEGDERFNDDQGDEGHTGPRVVYDHDEGCSISGGAVYHGTEVPDLVGWYVYGDFCSGTIWGYDTTSPADAPVVVELAQLGNLVAVAVGGNSELFAVSNAGTVSRFAVD